MADLSNWLLDPSGLTPHGFCLLWEPGLIWTYAAADGLTAASYLTIPVALSILANRRRDLIFRPVFILFAGFVLLCGMTHLLDVVTLWIPAYGLEAVFKVATALASIVTAIVLWQQLPRLMHQPSHRQMQLQEQRLAETAEIAADRKNLLDMVNVAAVMLREIDGTILFWSEGCRRLYGWTSEQAIGRSSHELLQTVFPTSLADADATLLQEGSWAGQLRHRRRDETEVVVAASFTLHDRADGGGQVVVETVADLSPLIKARIALRQSEARYASVVETAADGFVIASGDGRIEQVNKAMLSMFGYDHADEVVGRNLRVLMTAGQGARHDVYIADHQSGSSRVIGVPGRELLAVRRDGSEFPIDLSVSSFTADGKLRLTGIIRDASARKAAEAALLGSEGRLRLVQQVGGIAYSDQAVGESTILVSDEFKALYGLPVERTHISLEEWRGLIHDEDRDRELRAQKSIVEFGGTSNTQFRIRRPTGETRWVSMRLGVFTGANGEANRIIGAQQDITDIVAAGEALADRQQQLELRVTERTAALAKAEARFRGIFDSQFQFITLIGPDGTTMEMNRTALDAAALTREVIIGQPFWETAWWPEHERDRIRQDIAQAAQGKLIRRDVEIRGAGDQHLWIDFSLKPVRNPADNEIMWIIAESRDLTEKRHLADQLAQAQKVQALGQLAGGIAHDFNNILQAVAGAATLIETRPTDTVRVIHLAGVLIGAAARGTSITQRLLSFARSGELRARAIATADLLESMREVLAHTLGSSIMVELSVPPSLPALIADQAQLETVIINIGTNARDAMPNGGMLRLSAKIERVDRADTHPAGLAPGDYVRLEITDTGEGMDETTLARASEPFFTTKPQGQGTGLGVSMAKGFAEQSGGALVIESAQGVGTKVKIWLLQASEDVSPASADESRVQDGKRMPARVLVVDDDELVREMVAASLEEAGLSALVASSGAEAIALLEAGEIVDAMVSDLSMPGMNGVTTIQRARILRPRLPCYLLTGYVGDRAALSAENSFTLVRKPVSGRALAAQIEAGLERAKP